MEGGGKVNDIPSNMKAEIRQRAEQEWPGDFVMQMLFYRMGPLD